MRVLISVVTACLVGVLAQQAVADDAAEKAELDKFKGAWTFESMSFMGKKESPPPGTEIVFDGNTMTMKMGTSAKKATMKLNVATTPKQIDTTDTGPEKGTTELGIYELADDQLKMCVAIGGQPAQDDAKGTPKNEKDKAGKRPDAFDDQQGAIIVLKRKPK